MEKRHLLIAAMIVLTVGLLIHGFKTLRKAHFDRAGLNMADVDDTPYHVSSDEMDLDRRRVQGRGRGMHLAGATSIFNQYDFSGGKAIAKAKEEIKKKKKKKEKTEDKPAVVVDAAPYYNSKPNNTNGDNSNANQNVVGTVGPEPRQAAIGPAAGADTAATGTYQQWAALILGAPSPANVAKLVAAYKAHEVTNQVFFQLLDAMMAEQNPQEQSLAVTAASDVPSGQAFEFLVQVTKTQNSAAAQQAATVISGYSALNEVDALEVALSTYIGDATTVQDATTVLLNSAETNLQNRAPTATNGATPNLASVYAGFVPVLNKIIAAYTSNTTIENNAQSALALISSVVTTP